MAILQPIEGSELLTSSATLFLGMLNSTPFGYIIRQKVQGQNINQYIVEQIPIILSERFDETTFGSKTARDIVHEAVLELTYTSDDMKPFAKDMGYIDQEGKTKTPFLWDKGKRVVPRSRINAVFSTSMAVRAVKISDIFTQPSQLLNEMKQQKSKVDFALVIFALLI